MNFLFKKYRSLLIIFCVSPISYGCVNNTNETEKANQVIYKLIESDNHSDIQTVLNSYTDSIEFYSAGKEFTKGIKNVQASYEKLFKENKLSITTQILETRVFGETAFITGINKGTRTTLIDSSVNTIDDKYIAILLRKNSGEWKIDKLIWGLNH